jgi:hypothetical protein
MTSPAYCPADAKSYRKGRAKVPPGAIYLKSRRSMSTPSNRVYS